MICSASGNRSDKTILARLEHNTVCFTQTRPVVYRVGRMSRQTLFFTTGLGSTTRLENDLSFWLAFVINPSFYPLAQGAIRSCKSLVSLCGEANLYTGRGLTWSVYMLFFSD